MAEPQGPLEDRVARLEERVAELAAALAALRPPLPARDAAPSAAEPAALTAEEASEELISWVDRAYLLPRVATTSFILVVAFALRTLTDSRLLPAETGTVLGMLYALALIGYGWLAYRRKSPQAPVFALWGTIVMCAVVVETHRVFQALPTVTAYLMLVVTGGIGAAMSRSHKVALPVFTGTIGMSFAAFAVNYPSPVFPLLTVVLILANAFAALATGLLRASWLRWVLLALTLFMVQLWALKLGLYLAKLRPEELDFSIRWFLPATAGLALALAGIALLGVLGRLQQRVSKFDLVLPVVNAVWFCSAVRYALNHGLGEPGLYAVPLALAGVAQFGLSWWLIRRGGPQADGSAAFALAGSLFLALGLGSSLFTSTLIAILALALTVAATSLESGGIRLASYLLQVYASLTLALVLRATETTAPSLLGASASALLAATATYHYLWARRHPLPPGGPLSSRFNQDDRCAALLLVSALCAGFFTLRMGLYQGLVALHLGSPASFSSGQSVLINLAAVFLFLAALRRRNRELRNVAILVTLAATGKAALDLLSLKGVPLLASLFTFGLVAAIASLVLGRWKSPSPQP